jgi:hypothetical protein
MPEWSNGRPWKGRISERVSRVRIPLSPQLICTLVAVTERYLNNQTEDGSLVVSSAEFPGYLPSGARQSSAESIEIKDGVIIVNGKFLVGDDLQTITKKYRFERSVVIEVK